MVTIVKHEWHSHDRQYAIELDEALLSEIYPDLDEDEISEKLQQIVDGEVTPDEVFSDAWDNDVEVEWDFQYDDCWTDRKGGYEVTYELGDEDSWHNEPEPDPPSHKCTKCKWTGTEYEADWIYTDADGNDLDEARRVCKYCESDIELTEFGLKEEAERQERFARWAKDDEESEQEVPCYSCGAMHKESELPELSGQYHCPSCHEGWVMMDMREEEEDEDSEERRRDLEAALEDLKLEFEQLQVKEDSAEMRCTKCEWQGNWTDTDNNEDNDDICPECGAVVKDVDDE